MSDRIEKLIQSEAEESELMRGVNDEVLLGKGIRRNRGRESRMLSVRVPADDYAAIEAVAERMDVPVSALVRGWILSGLADHQGTTVPDQVERVAAEVQRLRSIVGR